MYTRTCKALAYRGSYIEGFRQFYEHLNTYIYIVRVQSLALSRQGASWILRPPPAGLPGTTRRRAALLQSPRDRSADTQHYIIVKYCYYTSIYIYIYIYISVTNVVCFTHVHIKCAFVSRSNEQHTATIATIVFRSPGCFFFCVSINKCTYALKISHEGY